MSTPHMRQFAQAVLTQWSSIFCGFTEKVKNKKSDGLSSLFLFLNSERSGLAQDVIWTKAVSRRNLAVFVVLRKS